MLAPAAVWAPQVGVLDTMGRASQTDVRSLVLPSPIESAFLGVLAAKHTHGLQSGGLVGYSTFFTGYQPGDGMLRAMSVGRLAAQGISAAARGLQASGLAETAWGSRWLPRLAQTHRFGLAGALTAVDAREFDLFVEKATGQGVRKRKTVLSRRDQNARNLIAHSGPYPSPETRAAALRSASVGPIPDDVLELRARNSAGRQAQRHFKDRTSKLWNTLAGWLGGSGFSPTGFDASEYVRHGDMYFRRGLEGSRGATWRNPTGKLLGIGAKAAVGFEIARMALDLSIDAAGAAYGSSVRTASRIHERFGVQHRMSGAYYNQAAVTERQRAVQEFNQSVLNPRTQLMGNEAFYAHG